MEQSIPISSARFQHRDLAILVGILSGTLLVVFASEAAGEQVLFLIITVPIWGFLGGYGSILAHRTLETNPLENPVLPWPDATPRTGTIQGPKICENCKTANPADALFCKNCGTKLGLVSSRA